MPQTSVGSNPTLAAMFAGTPGFFVFVSNTRQQIAISNRVVYTREGRIGIDIGTQTIAFSGNDVCDLRVLAPSAIAEVRNGLTKEIARVMRQMDRSRRAMNPQYYNENGTLYSCQRVADIRQRIRG